MGLCISSDAGKEIGTSKVILQDGRLLEYSHPVKVSSVLQRHSDCFLCNSDDMEFDDVLTSLDSDDDLQPGQIYFALPLNFLKRQIQPHEMAALAVKASAALMKCAAADLNCTRRSNLVFPLPESAPRKAAIRDGTKGAPRRIKLFTAKLDAIAE